MNEEIYKKLDLIPLAARNYPKIESVTFENRESGVIIVEVNKLTVLNTMDKQGYIDDFDVFKLFNVYEKLENGKSCYPTLIFHERYIDLFQLHDGRHHTIALIKAYPNINKIKCSMIIDKYEQGEVLFKLRERHGNELFRLVNK